MYTIILGLVTGSVAMFAMGDGPGWGRLILATIAGLVVGLGIDVGLMVLSGPLVARTAVMLPLYSPYGLTESGLIAIPFSLVGAVLAARRNWVRISDPNDLRR
jgi:hypothetical protein